MAAEPLCLSRAQVARMLDLAVEAAPAECCGLLVGARRTVREIVPLVNIAEDPERHFCAEPSALLRALLAAEGRGERLLAIYHSHPHGDAIPSPTDIREAHYPEAAQLIIGLGGRRPKMAAWRIEAGAVAPWELQIGQQDARLPSRAEPARPALVAVGALIALALTVALVVSAFG